MTQNAQMGAGSASIRAIRGSFNFLLYRRGLARRVSDVVQHRLVSRFSFFEIVRKYMDGDRQMD